MVKFPSVVFHSNLTALEVGLFSYLYLLKNREYKVCITYKKLRKQLNLSPLTLSRALRTLEKESLLSVVKRYFRYKNTFSHRNCYHLIAPSSDDPYLPLKEVLSLNIPLDAKGLLLYLIYLSNQEGHTFSPKSHILCVFRTKPTKAYKYLCDIGVVERDKFGVRVITEHLYRY